MCTAPVSHIAVIVVNYGTAGLAISAVESVLTRHHGGRAVDVHLVDNASPGEDATIFKRVHSEHSWGERVILHLETENHGFGRGNNIVIQKLLDLEDPPEAVLLLNPDARLENEPLHLLAEILEAHPNSGFVGARLAMPDGTARSAAFRFPSIVSEFSQALNFGPVARALSRWQVPLSPDCGAGEVDWVSGAALMIRTETLRKIGLFDPDFFLYYEEVELMWRGRQAGWRCRYVPEARFVHEEGAATDVKSIRVEAQRHPAYRYNSWRLYHLKTRGKIGAIFIAVATLAGAMGHQLLAKIRRRPVRNVPYFIRDFWNCAARPLLVEQDKNG